MTVGQLVQTTAGTWITEPPHRCPCGHPLGAPVATAALGAVGIFGTSLTGKQGRDDAKAIASEKLSHDRMLAQDARHQQRLKTPM